MALSISGNDVVGDSSSNLYYTSILSDTFLKDTMSN